jgi:hypothetical protein
LAEAADGAGMAIVFGNILDTIPGCLVIGAKFTDCGNLSLTLMPGMFLGGIPEAAASASMLTRAGYRPVAHAMIPVALEEGGSLVVLPTVAGILFALYLAPAESFV